MEPDVTPEMEKRIAESLPQWITHRPDLRQRLRAALAEPSEVTYEEFLDWIDENTHAEWVKGDIIVMSPASDRHQDLAGFLGSLLRLYAETKKLGIVRTAPFQMRLSESGREPDILFLTREHLDRLKETYLDGPADLVVEIVSPESVGRDRGDKFMEYEAAGIPEYWLIDPQREQAEFYQLDDHGHYRPGPIDEEGHYHSPTLPGFWLEVDWLWAETLPPGLEVLRALGVV